MAAATACAKRARLFDVPLDLLGMDDTVRLCEKLIEERRSVQHCVINAGKLVLCEDDPTLREVVNSCAIVNADGQSVVWAGRLMGHDVPERVTGIDLMERLIESAAEHGWPIYALGATDEVLAGFLDEARRRFPDLLVAGSHHGYFDDDAQMASEVAASGARVLFVAMPSPRKEYFLSQQRHRLGNLFAMGVGGSFDIWAGLTQRAPEWMRNSGLEWFFRLLQEPGRMWRRYLIGNVRFLLMVGRERFGKPAVALSPVPVQLTLLPAPDSDGLERYTA